MEPNLEANVSDFAKLAIEIDEEFEKAKQLLEDMGLSLEIVSEQ